MEEEKVMEYLRRLEPPQSGILDIEDTLLDKKARFKLSDNLYDLKNSDPDLSLVEKRYEENLVNYFNLKLDQFADIVGLSQDTQIWQFFHHILIWEIRGKEVDESTLDMMYEEVKKEYYGED